jgi:hypothetical protein
MEGRPLGVLCMSILGAAYLALAAVFVSQYLAVQRFLSARLEPAGVCVRARVRVRADCGGCDTRTIPRLNLRALLFASRARARGPSHTCSSRTCGGLVCAGVRGRARVGLFLSVFALACRVAAHPKASLAPLCAA